MGQVDDITPDQVVQKEILILGEGSKRPKMNHLVNVTYKAYFFDHTEFDSSKGQQVKMSLGDIRWPEGLWKGILQMRKNETAKIRIKKKKYGFGRKLKTEDLIFPEGYDEPKEVETEEGKAQLERRKRLMSKGIIYEVKLHDWIERVDIEGDGYFIKTTLVPSAKKEWEKPADFDEIEVSVKLYHFNEDPSNDLEGALKDKQPLEARDHWKHTMNGEEMAFTLRKILETMKRGEQTQTLVKASFVSQYDQGLWKFVTEKTGELPESSFFFVDVTLHSLIKVEDWFKDGTSFLKTYKKGKGAQPNSDSIVKSKSIQLNLMISLLENHCE